MNRIVENKRNRLNHKYDEEGEEGEWQEICEGLARPRGQALRTGISGH